MIRTQTFKLGKYYIEETPPMQGLCDVPNGYDRLRMYVPKGDTQKELATIIHEISHAEGIPDHYLHNERDFSEHVAKYLWRRGWRIQS